MCTRFWELGPPHFPLHQGLVTDSLPSLLIAAAVMAVARRAATPARVWRSLPYTTKTRIGICLDFFRVFTGIFLFLLYMFFK